MCNQGGCYTVPRVLSKALYTASAGCHGTAAICSALAASKGYTVLSSTPAVFVAGIGYGLAVAGNAASAYADCMDAGIASATTEVGMEVLTSTFKSKLSQQCVDEAYKKIPEWLLKIVV